MELRKIRKAEVNDALFDLHEYNINPLTREIYLGAWEGDVEEEPGVDYRMAMQFIRNITFLSRQGNDEIVIHQCTIGGESPYGMAIYDAIKSCPAHVTMICYGHSRSMSSVTLQACDTRILTSNCYFMVHHGTISLTDTHKGAVSYMRFAERDSKVMLNIYAERCSLTVQQIERKLDKNQEWYMTAEEAVDYGFADKIKE